VKEDVSKIEGGGGQESPTFHRVNTVTKKYDEMVLNENNVKKGESRGPGFNKPSREAESRKTLSTEAEEREYDN